MGEDSNQIPTEPQPDFGTMSAVEAKDLLNSASQIIANQDRIADIAATAVKKSTRRTSRWTIFFVVLAAIPSVAFGITIVSDINAQNKILSAVEADGVAIHSAAAQVQQVLDLANKTISGPAAAVAAANQKALIAHLEQCIYLNSVQAQRGLPPAAGCP
jgi:hypothetical protein